MFQFTPFPSLRLFIHLRIPVHYYRWVPPFGNLRFITDICSLPQLIAACHVLHRLLVPRHPPYALFNLTVNSSKIIVKTLSENFFSGFSVEIVVLHPSQIFKTCLVSLVSLLG